MQFLLSHAKLGVLNRNLGVLQHPLHQPWTATVYDIDIFRDYIDKPISRYRSPTTLSLRYRETDCAYDIVRTPPDLFLWMAIGDRCMKVDGLDACPHSTVATDCAARGRGWQSGRPPSTLMRNWIRCLCGSQALSRCCWISRGLTVCWSHREWLYVLFVCIHFNAVML